MRRRGVTAILSISFQAECNTKWRWWDVWWQCTGGITLSKSVDLVWASEMNRANSCDDSVVMSEIVLSIATSDIVVPTATASYLNDLITVHIPAGPTRRSSTRPLLTVPHLASDFARRSFCFFHQQCGILFLVMYNLARRKQLSSQD